MAVNYYYYYYVKAGVGNNVLCLSDMNEILKKNQVGLGLLCEISRSHSFRHITIGRTPLDE